MNTVMDRHDDYERISIMVRASRIAAPVGSLLK
jgi:hypothetical protein